MLVPSLHLCSANLNPNLNPTVTLTLTLTGLLQLGAYTSPTLNLRPKELHLRDGVVYEFKVTVRAGTGKADDARTR